MGMGIEYSGIFLYHSTLHSGYGWSKEYSGIFRRILSHNVGAIYTIWYWQACLGPTTPAFYIFTNKIFIFSLYQMFSCIFFMFLTWLSTPTVVSVMEETNWHIAYTVPLSKLIYRITNNILKRQSRKMFDFWFYFKFFVFFTSSRRIHLPWLPELGIE